MGLIGMVRHPQDGSLGTIHYHSRGNLWDTFGDRLGISQQAARPLFYLVDDLETALLRGTSMLPRLVDAAKLAPATVKFLQVNLEHGRGAGFDLLHRYRFAGCTCTVMALMEHSYSLQRHIVYRRYIC